MMLLSALMIGFMTSIMADTRSSGVDRDETQAYAVAHAGMEKLTSDLAALFLTDYSPNGTQISAVDQLSTGDSGLHLHRSRRLDRLQGAVHGQGRSPTCTPSTALTNCVVVATPTTAIPVPDDPTTGHDHRRRSRTRDSRASSRTTTSWSRRGRRGGSEIRMRRELQTVAVPVFQFGLFSESSLSFHAGANFNFGGRIHTNGNLFLTAGNGTTLTLSDKVTAVGEIVRKYLDNGILATSNWNGTVSMAKSSGRLSSTSPRRRAASPRASRHDGAPGVWRRRPVRVA